MQLSRKCALKKHPCWSSSDAYSLNQWKKCSGQRWIKSWTITNTALGGKAHQHSCDSKHWIYQENTQAENAKGSIIKVAVYFWHQGCKLIQLLQICTLNMSFACDRHTNIFNSMHFDILMFYFQLVHIKYHRYSEKQIKETAYYIMYCAGKF